METLPDDHATESTSCPRCGLTRADLRAHGRMGCAGCYETFRAEVVHAVEALHGVAVDLDTLPLPWPPSRGGGGSGGAEEQR